MILGEACTRLMAHHAEFLRLHPHVPWRSIRDMRNQVAHGYFTIDVDVVWRTVRHALPELRDALPAVIAAAAGHAAPGKPFSPHSAA